MAEHGGWAVATSSLLSARNRSSVGTRRPGLVNIGRARSPFPAGWWLLTVSLLSLLQPEECFLVGSFGRPASSALPGVAGLTAKLSTRPFHNLLLARNNGCALLPTSSSFNLARPRAGSSHLSTLHAVAVTFPPEKIGAASGQALVAGEEVKARAKVGGVVLLLVDLLVIVEGYGGAEQVTLHKLWGAVARELGVDPKVTSPAKWGGWSTSSPLQCGMPRFWPRKSLLAAAGCRSSLRRDFRSDYVRDSAWVKG